MEFLDTAVTFCSGYARVRAWGWGPTRIRKCLWPRLLFAAVLAVVALESGSAQSIASFDVRSFGAKGDGRTLDTDAINKAISAAHAAGGGTVRFPAGSYLSTSIHLQSHVGLFIDHGATIVAAETSAGPYDEPEPNAWDKFQDFGHSHWHNALMWGDGVENVSITGPGLIHGRGLVRNHNDTTPKGSGDKAISLKNSRNVVIRASRFCTADGSRSSRPASSAGSSRCAASPTSCFATSPACRT